ncbi:MULTISPECIES: branched-chain amino acid ABC transporter substrate-binding protein [Comamonas]|jgi:branched-chain amino acid transport system substrate-binding protein|uniref:Branched-chain amino acid ABC transporter substrate-binding protein n=1 Tax=Comamonas terrigena TaxID=32013 RepID=A0A2A7UWP3_COMTR|nr:MULTISPECIES: branched-chain amino acid ABC transporter substrate-binding protein [Comamonas]MBD9531407.1 branched-chain amino acid ABC transporter substrate-binding protein [Comamonas sp. CMM01]MBV7417391.1 branched-chain amino acid ABC transporter substrate-binding protein [Comamonas sp. CMM03]MDH0050093.1 branched-chain amino acid ABC transporter substrate-binding protein [Comamonas terrigena]MDH0512343.1 branched-chain amino acid ABC transporter substrate-binding protein [Comamonas terri
MQFALKTTFATLTLAALTASLSLPAHAQKGETVKIAWLDPLSGLMAALGTNQMKSWQFMAEEFSKNNPAGVKFEIVPIDNKLSPQETTSALRSAMDQGVRYVVQGNGSGPALAIMDALDKHNARNKGKEVVYLNYAAVDPDLTNSKCSYWHFRLDADTSMKMEALTTYMKDLPEVKKVYLINQNYAHGHQVSKYAKEMLKRKRPDVEIVGDDMAPLAQVRDFSPYIAKIKQSGADSVITGNWGSDLALLVKAANDAGLNNVKFYTYYGIATGAPTAMGAAAAGKVYMVGYSHLNAEGPINKIVKDFKAKFNDDMYTASVYHGFAMLSEAMARAKSTDPVKVAAVMEGMKFKSFNGEVEMRKTDHQLQQGLYISRWEKAGGKYPIDSENTGYTFVPVKYFEPYVASTPTSCQMKRPS